MQIQLGDAAEETNYTAFRDIRTQAPEKPISEYYDIQSCEQVGAKGGSGWCSWSMQLMIGAYQTHTDTDACGGC